jgi:hypothetical protein
MGVPPRPRGWAGAACLPPGSALARKGAEVTVLTRVGDGRSTTYNDGDVRVVTTPSYGLHPPDFLTWAAQFNVGLLETAIARLSPETST